MFSARTFQFHLFVDIFAICYKILFLKFNLLLHTKKQPHSHFTIPKNSLIRVPAFVILQAFRKMLEKFINHIAARADCKLFIIVKENQ
jgi:hypothetical protein